MMRAEQAIGGRQVQGKGCRKMVEKRHSLCVEEATLEERVVRTRLGFRFRNGRYNGQRDIWHRRYKG